MSAVATPNSIGKYLATEGCPPPSRPLAAESMFSTGLQRAGRERVQYSTLALVRWEIGELGITVFQHPGYTSQEQEGAPPLASCLPNVTPWFETWFPSLLALFMSRVHPFPATPAPYSCPPPCPQRCPLLHTDHPFPHRFSGHAFSPYSVSPTLPFPEAALPSPSSPVSPSFTAPRESLFVPTLGTPQGLTLHPLLALLQLNPISNPGILNRQASLMLSGAGAQLPRFKF